MVYIDWPAIAVELSRQCFFLIEPISILCHSLQSQADRGSLWECCGVTIELHIWLLWSFFLVNRCFTQYTHGALVIGNQNLMLHSVWSCGIVELCGVNKEKIQCRPTKITWCVYLENNTDFSCSLYFFVALIASDMDWSLCCANGKAHFLLLLS